MNGTLGGSDKLTQVPASGCSDALRTIRYMLIVTDVAGRPCSAPHAMIREESEISCADGEVEAVAVERIRSGAAQRTRDGETVLAELGIDVCRALGPKHDVPSSTC